MAVVPATSLNRYCGIESVSLTAVVMPTSADVVDFVGKNPEALAMSPALMLLQRSTNQRLPNLW